MVYQRDSSVRDPKFYTGWECMIPPHLSLKAENNYQLAEDQYCIKDFCGLKTL